jgi:hypothetical protein
MMAVIRTTAPVEALSLDASDLSGPASASAAAGGGDALKVRLLCGFGCF